MRRLLIILTMLVALVLQRFVMAESSAELTISFRIAANAETDQEVIAAANIADGSQIEVNGKIVAAWLPVVENNELLFLKEGELVTRKRDRHIELLVLMGDGDVTEADFASFTFSKDGNNKFGIDFILNKHGSEEMGRLTLQNIGKRLATIINGKVQSAVIIKSQITSQGRISCNLTEEQEDRILEGFLQQTNPGPVPSTNRARGLLPAVFSMVLILAIIVLIYLKCSRIKGRTGQKATDLGKAVRTNENMKSKTSIMRVVVIIVLVVLGAYLVGYTKTVSSGDGGNSILLVTTYCFSVLWMFVGGLAGLLFGMISLRMVDRLAVVRDDSLSQDI